jgi:hypothetical protein
VVNTSYDLFVEPCAYIRYDFGKVLLNIMMIDGGEVRFQRQLLVGLEAFKRLRACRPIALHCYETR